jgi:hypothetical protein
VSRHAGHSCCARCSTRCSSLATESIVARSGLGGQARGCTTRRRPTRITDMTRMGVQYARCAAPRSGLSTSFCPSDSDNRYDSDGRSIRPRCCTQIGPVDSLLSPSLSLLSPQLPSIQRSFSPCTRQASRFYILLLSPSLSLLSRVTPAALHPAILLCLNAPGLADGLANRTRAAFLLFYFGRIDSYQQSVRAV